MTNQDFAIVRFPAVSLRRLNSPYDEEGRRTYVAVVRVKDLPEALDHWMEVNPRDPNPNSGVSKKIEATLRDAQDTFFFKNRGITLMVERVEFDTSDSSLEIALSDPKKNGILDGGHTFKVIRNFIDGIDETELQEITACVKLEIIEGVSDFNDAINIVEARNTSTQVKDQSILELQDQFEEIKATLDGKPYASRVAYKEIEFSEDGSRKDIDIKELLSYLVCFDAEKFGDNDHPIKAYSSKGAVIDHFKNSQKEDGRMSKYVPLLPKILELHDTIYQHLPEAYNAGGGKFGQLTGVTSLANKPHKKRVDLPYIGEQSDYQIPSGFVYPVLAAFRSLVSINGKQCQWKVDPILFFKEIKKELANRVGEQALGLKNPNKLGKDNSTWRACYDFVQLELLKRKA